LALITTERTAVQILVNEYRQRDDLFGLNNFARTVLGAHAEQAKRLAGWAVDVINGVEPSIPDETEDTIQVSKQVDGKTLNLSLKADHLPITTYEELVEFFEIDTERWRPTTQRFNFWGNGDSPNFQVRAEFREVEYQGLRAEDREAFRQWAEGHALPRHDLNFYLPEKTGNLLEIMLADLHVGKFVEGSYDVDIAIERTREAVLSILRRATVDGVERIALVLNGDTFNDDNGRRTTTKGTPQQSTGRWQSIYQRVRELVTELALTASRLAFVDIYVISGNHDKERSFYLADGLHGSLANYRDRITVHTETERNAIDWGRCLIGLMHGDGLKPVDIAFSVLREYPTTGKDIIEVHLGHQHTRREDEIHGVLLRRFRTPSEDDDWHRENLYCHNVKSIVGILWNKERGEIANYPFTFVGDT
jgi:predicted phosphodiesterase